MNGLFSEVELRSACQVLFGSHIDPPVEFFSYLQPEGVKAAYRKRARETHPDSRCGNFANPAYQPVETFHQVTDAYNLLFSFVQQEPLKKTGRINSPFSVTPRSPGNVYHNGTLPHRRLELGRYLYYRGLIPYHSLIAAVAWQRKQRPPVGRIARNLGMLTDDAVQMILRSTKCSGFFGDKAIHHGLLTKAQVSLLLLHQRSRQQKLGRYFIESGYVSEREIEAAVVEMRRHNAKIPFQP